MCEHVDFGDGNFAVICGGRRRRRYCACGHQAPFLCDWKVKEKRSGTCDLPICEKHALQVAPDKHLCPQHQKSYEEWKRKHPGFIAQPDYAQMSLLH